MSSESLLSRRKAVTSEALSENNDAVKFISLPALQVRVDLCFADLLFF